MKLHAHIAAATVGLLTLVGGSAVNAASPALQANVPFAFSAGNTTLDAGSYTVERGSGPHGALILRSNHGGVILLVRPGEAAVAGKSTRLVFHRYGERYYLVRCGSTGPAAMTCLKRARSASRRHAPASGRWGPPLSPSSPPWASSPPRGHSQSLALTARHTRGEGTDLPLTPRLRRINPALMFRSGPSSPMRREGSGWRIALRRQHSF